ncbi:MAG: hypothetical protein M5U13_15390 [Thermoanaerobaculia bacterium]|nr:hypothetical protein [Thermoanaerobaculia bacterium]
MHRSLLRASRACLPPLGRAASALLLALAVGGAAGAGTAPAAGPFPESFTYRGHALDAAGAPLAGRVAVELRFLAGERVLRAERHSGIAVRDGRFTLPAGRGLALAEGARRSPSSSPGTPRSSSRCGSPA